jgi:proline dehydrogenase
MHLLNKLVVASLPAVPRPIVRHFASRYIAGDSLEQAVRCVRHLNQQEQVLATMDVLGEDTTSREEAEAARDESEQVLHTIAREGLDSNLSVKLTSLGLKLDTSFCRENVRQILQVAASHGNFVRIDMEDSSCTSETIEIFRALQRDHPNCGIVLQAYLRRSEDDVRELIKTRTNVRLCKGIYREPERIAFQGRAEVQQNFLRLLRMLLSHGCYVGIATHDSVLVDGASAMIRELGLDRHAYEFQMLLGVRPELRRALVHEGHRVRLYVPFGEHWHAYSIRRFKENPEVAGYVVRALFRPNV